MIDARRLCFVIGDVSGKGVPASLFMATTKTLARSITLHVSEDLGRLVTTVNHELARENSETLFVTLLIGILDVETGALTLVNAGHDAPWRITSDGQVSQILATTEVGGPPLCVLEDFVYRAQQTQLMPGDTLCLITDGITEAMNFRRETYGSERLLKVLQTVSGAQAEDVVTRVRDDVAGFTNGVDASDDLTLLVLRWDGSAV